MTDIVLPDLCDAYPDQVRVVTPGFRPFGARTAFGGRLVTIRCFEDNSLVAERVDEKGDGQVLVVDAGGSMRCGMFGDNLARKAAANGWAGVVVYGCVRDVEVLATIEVRIMALAAHPLRSIKRGIGERDVPVTFCGVHVCAR